MSAECPCPAIFITGTDTGVGKTLVAAAVARFLSSRGLRVGVMKPCETGVTDPDRPGDDARLLKWAAGSADDDALIAPYRLKLPAAPAQAAGRENVIIDPERIAEAFAQICHGKDLVLVEGAGGLMVPLRGGYLMADLARRLGLPLLVVARPSLGTINHTLLTIFAAKTMDLEVGGFIINRMPAQADAVEAEAPHQLAALASADLLAVLPEVGGQEEERVERLAAEIAAQTTLPWLVHGIGLGHELPRLVKKQCPGCRGTEPPK
jgi:dethiobiotin synthetase